MSCNGGAAIRKGVSKKIHKNTIKKSYDKNLSFSKAIKLFQDCYELESHCEISIENGYGDDQFSLPDTYSTDTEFCNANRLMEEYLTDDFMDKFVEQSYTGYLDDIIIIDEKKESKIVEYFESENIKIIRDDKLMNETLNPDWFHKMEREQRMLESVSGGRPVSQLPPRYRFPNKRHPFGKVQCFSLEWEKAYHWS